MKKLPTHTILKLLPFCILIFASIACRIGDVTQMVVDVLTDADHQSINELLVGREQESQELSALSDEDLIEFVNSMTPDELEEFVDSLTSDQREEFIKMLPADKQAELEKYEDAELNSLDPEEEIKPAFPTGAYSGVFPGDFEHSDVIKNEINVDISPTGTVTGSAIIHFSRTTIRENICSSYHETERTYRVSGKIDGLLDQIIQVDITTREYSSFFDCRKEEENTSSETFHECTAEADFRVREDGTIIISSTATRGCGAYLQVE